MKNIEIWQEILPDIKLLEDIFVIHNFRNFDRKLESQNQTKKYETKIIKFSQINEMRLYICPFAFFGTIAHAIIWIKLKDWSEICISREAQLQQWKERQILQSLQSWYRAIVLRASFEDMFGLRCIRKEKIIWYKLNIDLDNMIYITNIFCQTTNEVNNKYTKYNLFDKNCVSGIWNKIYKKYNLSKYTYWLIFTRFLPNILLSKKYIYPNTYQIKFDTKWKNLVKFEI